MSEPRMPTARPDYPDAARLDLVEELHGHRVADPYRWLEDATTASRPRRGRRPRTRCSPRPSRTLARAASGCATASPTLLDAGVVSARRRGAASGSSSCAAPPTQEHAVLLTVDPDGTERVLVDPMAIDPTGADDARRLAADQGGRPARLPALRGRHRGVRAARHGRGDRRGRWTGRSTARATPPSPGCPAARPSTTYAGWRPSWCRRTRSSIHRRVWLHRVGTDPARTSLVFGDGPRQDELLRRLGVDGRPLAVGRRVAGHRAAQRPVAGRPAASPLEAPDLRAVQADVDAQTVAAGRPRRPGLRVHRPRRPARPARA